MGTLITPDIIEDFRKIMNDLHFYEELSNVNGKDDYSFICSQIDWIEAWTNELEKIDVRANGFHTRTVNFAQFILGVDTIVTASKNLLEYFKYDSSDLYNSKDIFKSEINDFLYFKRIRSTFAIHPIDIQVKKTKEQLYASWVSSVFKDGEFNILIYKQVPDTPSQHVKISHEQLLSFTYNWYEKIQCITKLLKKEKRITYFDYV